MSLYPWEVTDDLQPERLYLLAMMATKARNDAADQFVRNRDNAWSLGCRAYSFTCSDYANAYASQQYPWLTVNFRGLTCTLIIENTPLKFYRGTSESINSRSLRSGIKAMLAQRRLDFIEHEILRDSGEWTWLIAIDTDENGRALEVVVFQANSHKETRYEWTVPLNGPLPVVAPVTDVRPQGVELPPAALGIPGEEAKNDATDK